MMFLTTKKMHMLMYANSCSCVCVAQNKWSRNDLKLGSSSSLVFVTATSTK